MLLKKDRNTTKCNILWRVTNCAAGKKVPWKQKEGEREPIQTEYKRGRGGEITQRKNTTKEIENCT